jgi:hypothetical protein
MFCQLLLGRLNLTSYLLASRLQAKVIQTILLEYTKLVKSKNKRQQGQVPINVESTMLKELMLCLDLAKSQLKFALIY